MRNKAFLSFITMILIMTFLPLLSFGAPEDDITMEAEVGFDGYFQLGQWLPISVYIENKGEDIKGEIEIAGNQDSSTAMLFTAPAVIPKGSKKRIDLYMFMNTLQKNVDIDLKSNGKLIKRLTIDDLTPMSKSNFFMGVLTDDQSGLNYWWERQTGNRLFTNYEAIALNEEDIPSKKEVMDNFSMLIVDDFDTGKLSPTQRESLLNWINEGGILMVGTGGNGIKTLKGLSDDILDIEGGNISTQIKPQVLSDLAETEILTEMPMELMELKFSSPWKVAAGDDSNSHIIMKRQGQGYIFVSSFALGKQPITGWTGSKALWEAVFNEQLEDRVLNMLQDPHSREKSLGDRMHYSLFGALANIKEMEPPSASRLIQILVIYLIIVGPINYLILKKLDRRELIWFTIPILVMLFSFGIYNLGSMVKGNDVVTNVISVVELSDDNPSREVGIYTGVFIPKRGNYKFSMEGEDILAPTIPGNNYDHRPDSGGIKNITAKITQGATPITEIFDMNMWTMETFATEIPVEGLGNIEGDLSYRDGKIVGSIENKTNAPLEDVAVLTNLGYYKVGNLAEGGKKDIEFAISHASNPSYYYDAIMQGLIDELYPMDDYNSNNPRRDLVRDLVPRPAYSVSGRSEEIKDIGLEAMLFGFSDIKLGEDIYIDGKLPKKTYRTNLVIDRASINTNIDGKTIILPGTINGKVDSKLSQNLERHESQEEILEFYLYDNKQVAFYFDMEPFSAMDIDKLTIHITTANGRFPEDGSVSILVYSREADDFVDAGEGLDISLGDGTIEIDPSSLERYMDDEYKLYIKVGVGDDVNQDIQIYAPTIGIEGRQR